jgi:primase-polymerase (primpol)-like protein
MPSISACRLDFLVDDETKLIGLVSGILQISEYEIFRIAYQRWFDHAISEKRLDSLFKDYLMSGLAPYWVNDFARKVHEKLKAGELNYKDYGIKRRVCDHRTRVKGWIIISFLIILMLVYSCLISHYPSY